LRAEGAVQALAKEVDEMSVIKNIMLFGVGVASLTREKIEEAVEDLIKRGEIASADRSKAVEELHHKAQAAAAEIRKIVDERVEAVSQKLRISEDLKKLEAAVGELAARIDKLEAPKKAKPKK
jgi:polyhydroxyalkanoate synthesis regulator phasin